MFQLKDKDLNVRFTYVMLLILNMLILIEHAVKGVLIFTFQILYIYIIKV